MEIVREGAVCEVHVDVFVPQIGVRVGTMEGTNCELGFVRRWEGPAGEGGRCWAVSDVSVSSCYARVVGYVCVLEVGGLVAMR